MYRTLINYNYIHIHNDISALNDKNVIVWSRSINALYEYKRLATSGINVVGFTDSFARSGDDFAGLPVYSYEDTRKMQDIVIYVANKAYSNLSQVFETIFSSDDHPEVYADVDFIGVVHFDTAKMQELITNDIDAIDHVRAALSDSTSVKVFDNCLRFRTTNDSSLLREIYSKDQPQYFTESDVLKPADNDIFIDCGAFSGSTSLEFTKWSPHYEKIYLMEPDPLMYEITKEFVRLNKIARAEVFNLGAYSHTAELSFHEDASTGSSKINENGETTIKTTSIDELLNGEQATFIKMDIEGVEMPALEGAHETILRYKPKLAICVYHKDDDLWQIPYYIHNKYPFYKLYMRHYSAGICETVLYATL